MEKPKITLKYLYTDDRIRYKFTMRYNGKTRTGPFFTGTGWHREPSSDDVLQCLVNDALSYATVRDVQEFADEFGYEVAQAQPVYKACKRFYDTFVQWFGEAWIYAIQEELNQ